MKGGQIMRRWLTAAGIRTFKVTRGGFKVETPSYYVARLNLVGLNQRAVDKITRSVETTEYKAVAEQSAAVKKYLKERYASTSLPEEMRYVNVTGGTKYTGDQFDSSLVEALAWADSFGHKGPHVHCARSADSGIVGQEVDPHAFGD